MNMKEIIQLKATLREENKAYRLTSKPIVPDAVFDSQMEMLEKAIDEEEFIEFLEVLKEDVIIYGSERKEKLPHIMASLDKVKTLAEIQKWYTKYNISETEEIVLTPKYDGLSLLVNENNHKAWTSGDGTVGQRSHDHFKAMRHGETGRGVTYGEAIMLRSIFAKKYSKEILGEDGYENPRNLVSGQLNSPDPTKILKDMYYVRYSVINSQANKEQQLEYCNSLNELKVPFKVTRLCDLTEKGLLDLYKEWRKDVLIDGIVIDINRHSIREELGRHASTDNPQYARAYKSKDFEEVKQATVVDLIIKVSKQGYVIPVIQITPTRLDEVTVTRSSVYNYKTVVDLGIGKGAVVMIKRSGQVIPKVVDVIKKVKTIIPTICPSCGEKLDWNETEVHLECINPNCEAQRYQNIVSFFKIMDVEEVGEGTLKACYAAGYDTVGKILKMRQSDFRKLDGFGDRSAEIAYTNIHSKMSEVSLPQLMHASGCFRILGSTKLALVSHLADENPTVGELNSIKGFSDTSSKSFITGLKKFKEFVKDLPITIKKKEEVKMPTSNKCEGKVFVFTGFRSEELEEKIRSCNGEVGSGVNKRTTHLVMKKKGSGSGKEQKAIDLGITIWDKDEIEKFLGK